MLSTAIFITLALALSNADGPPPDADPKQLLEYWGYPVEVKEVETQDGYLLKLYRIPHGRNEKTPKDIVRPVVLLQHGLGTSAVDWLVNSPDKSAGYLFADAGFDVWLGNFRGSKYGRQHKLFGPEAQQFWQFSWNDMATKDLLTIINAVTSETKAEKIYYVAHSLGVTAGLALFSSNATVAKKVKQVHALAPIHILQNAQGILKYTKSFLKDANLVSNLLSSLEYPGEYTPNTQIQKAWAKYVCRDPENDLHCKNVLLMISGPGTSQIDANRTEAIQASSPVGISIQTIIHLGQMLQHGQFKAYDYGNPQQNREHYGNDQATPPIYNIVTLNSLGVSVFLYSSEYDWIAQSLDVANAANYLQNVLASNVVVPSFNHMEFIWGTRAAAEVYEPIAAQIASDFWSKRR